MMGTLGHEAEVWEEIVSRGEDIGHNVAITRVGGRGPECSGLILYHRHSDGSVCGGSVAFAMPHGAPSRPRGVEPNDRALWHVECYEPMTLAPSITDHTCSENLHGHIVGGLWVPCG